MNQRPEWPENAPGRPQAAGTTTIRFGVWRYRLSERIALSRPSARGESAPQRAANWTQVPLVYDRGQPWRQVGQSAAGMVLGGAG